MGLGFARPSVNDAVAWSIDVGAAFDLLERPAPTLPPAPDEVLESDP